MTDLLAGYFLLGIAIVLLIVGMWFKVVWVFMVSAVAWIMAGLYFIIDKTPNGFGMSLGIFCCVAGMATMLSPWLFRKPTEKEKPNNPEEDWDRDMASFQEDIAKTRKTIRSIRGR